MRRAQGSRGINWGKVVGPALNKHKSMEARIKREEARLKRKQAITALAEGEARRAACWGRRRASSRASGEAARMHTQRVPLLLRVHAARVKKWKDKLDYIREEKIEERERLKDRLENKRKAMALHKQKQQQKQQRRAGAWPPVHACYWQCAQCVCVT